VNAPSKGCFIPPVLISVSGIADLEREVFGPVLHVTSFEADEIEDVTAAVNARGYGLTFGLHTRIDGRVQEVADDIHVGNLYVNRNQIGAIVGSQPFGGEGLSGTGPKAGGPHYLPRFARPRPAGEPGAWDRPCDLDALAKRLLKVPGGAPLGETELPGPTGESNTLRLVTRGPVLCMGPGQAAMNEQIAMVRALGGVAVGSNGSLTPADLTGLQGLCGAIWWGEDARAYAMALAERDGPILPLITGAPDLGHVVHERHLCIDTTAAGGNAALLAG